MGLKAWLDYRSKDQDLAFKRTHAAHEVDFLVGRNFAIEVKATRCVSSGDLKGLLARRKKPCVMRMQ